MVAPWRFAKYIGFTEEEVQRLCLEKHGDFPQIKERKYPEAVAGYGGEILLVGISCRKDAPAGQRRHTCVIERHRVSCERDAKDEVHGRGTIVKYV